MEKLIFQESPAVELCTNTFINVPIILQYDTTPLIEVVREQEAGHMVKIPIFHNDGTKLAVCKGSRLFLTEDGKRQASSSATRRLWMCAPLTGA